MTAVEILVDFQPYSTERLRHPQWQRRRLDRFNVAGWRCERCRAENELLDVHHCGYVIGREPWQYADCDLLVLCRSCHVIVHRAKRELRAAQTPSAICAALRTLGVVLTVRESKTCVGENWRQLETVVHPGRLYTRDIRAAVEPRRGAVAVWWQRHVLEPAIQRWVQGRLP